MIKTVMFDLDGTLLPFEQEDFIKQYFGCLGKKLVPFGYAPEDTVKNVWAGTKAMVLNDGSRPNSAAFWETFRQAFPDKPDVRGICDEFYTNEFDLVKACLKRTPNHKPLIERLKSAGIDTVLATNPLFPECAVATRLKWVGLSESDFSYITNYDNSTYCKPNPKYYTELLEKLNLSADECFMVGNSVPDDILPTNALGIRNFLIPEFAENPDSADISTFRSGTLEQAISYILSL